LGTNSWTLLAEHSSRPAGSQGFDWNTRLFPDGYYLLKASILLPDLNYSQYQVPVTLENGLSGLAPSVEIPEVGHFSVIRGTSAIGVELSGPDIQKLSIFIQSGVNGSDPQLLARLDAPILGVNSFLFDSTQYENGIYTLIFKLYDGSVGLTETRLAVDVNNLSR